MQEYVLGFAFDERNGRVLMVEKTRGPEVNHGKWNGIGGKIDGDEEPIAAMHREWAEETRLSPQEWEEFGEMRGKGYRVHLFSVEFEGDPRIAGKNDVGEAMSWWPPESLLPFAQNVTTMINHALYGVGNIFITN